MYVENGSFDFVQFEICTQPRELNDPIRAWVSPGGLQVVPEKRTAHALLVLLVTRDRRCSIWYTRAYRRWWRMSESQCSTVNTLDVGCTIRREIITKPQELSVTRLLIESAQRSNVFIKRRPRLAGLRKQGRESRQEFVVCRQRHEACVVHFAAEKTILIAEF